MPKDQKTNKMEKTTNVFTVLDEDKMMIAEQTIALNNGFHKHVLPAIFETEKDADEWASSRLEMWTVVKSHFNHKFIEHKQNTKPEILKVEAGRMLDTDNQRIHVTTRFGKWTIEFDWSFNTRSNWVHTNNEPTHLDGVEVEWIDFTCGEENQTGKDARAILNHFDFQDDEMGMEIENKWTWESDSGWFNIK